MHFGVIFVDETFKFVNNFVKFVTAPENRVAFASAAILVFNFYKLN